MSFSQRRYKVSSHSKHWYVETQFGYDGPFEEKIKAEEYARLLGRADSARVEFAGIDDQAFCF